MSGTALDHRLVRDYLSELDVAMRGLPHAHACELKEQIIAHLDDALEPAAGDQEVAAVLGRLGSPADLAAEAGAVSYSPAARPGLGSRSRRWCLVVVIAVLAVTAATLGALRIGGEASSYAAATRDQHLTRLDAAVVTFTRDVEDERDLSAAYAAGSRTGPVPSYLSQARAATDAAAGVVRSDAAGIGAGYSPQAVHAIAGLLVGVDNLKAIRGGISPSSDFPASQLIRAYSGNIIGPADTFAATVGDAVSDPHLQATATSLVALLRAENDQSVQRAILFAAFNARPPLLLAENLSALQLAATDERSDLTVFNTSASPAEQTLYGNTVSGTAVDMATSTEIRAEQDAATHPSIPLTMDSGLNGTVWYHDMTTTIDDTRIVTGRLTTQLSSQANTLKLTATWILLLTSLATLFVLLVLLVPAILARPLRK